ncbi:hypothetical protein BD779DRAFT_1611042 [Infundibulicybe gibba]|nr:hypothetical protein BD779DRAFT_1611042 [Infundibulicybe gibba]
MDQDYEVWFRDPRMVMRSQLSNPDFKDEIDYSPLQEFGPDGQRLWTNLMSGNWAWQQADIISEDPRTHGAVFVPVILGSDKTTVSVATGQNEYYPLYASLGNVHNNVRRAHRNAVSIIGFLSIPKTDRDYANDPTFRKFRRHLFHESLRWILEPLRGAMTTPEVAMCPDGHYRRVVYGLGPYIADYPEQVLLSCVVQGWCPRRNDLDGPSGRRSHELSNLLINSPLDRTLLWNDYGLVSDVMLIAPDILHQLVKGSFKDHLVGWVGEYLTLVHGARRAAKIMADIDRRIAAVPPFPGLRRFPQGRGFLQWTGDDSKALMKTLDEIDEALARFHRERSIFETVGVRLEGFSLPRQHAMKHYRILIEMFGAPNGLCSSITESKHIKAVKEPWRRSSRHNALHQMLTINRNLDRLNAARTDFTARGMLDMPYSIEDSIVEGPRIDASVVLAKTPVRPYIHKISTLAMQIGEPDLHLYIHNFLIDQLYPGVAIDPEHPPIARHPILGRRIDVFHSAVATYYAPSDYSGIGGMHRQRIRSVPSWRG